uniref:Uncharacterized protein n=1 Tax=Cannabis sativa TaxID=3483 RepID=A0A803QDD3_CANSA
MGLANYRLAKGLSLQHGTGDEIQLLFQKLSPRVLPLVSGYNGGSTLGGRGLTLGSIGVLVSVWPTIVAKLVAPIVATRFTTFDVFMGIQVMTGTGVPRSAVCGS